MTASPLRPRPRRGPTSILVAAAAAVLLLAACTSNGSSNGSGALGSVSTSPTAGGGAGSGVPSSAPTSTPTATPTTATPTTAPPSTPPASHAYPSDYAAAILQAWASHDHAYLALLTDTGTANTIFSWGNINTHWTFINGDGAAGSSYDSYYNNGGDEITIRVINEQIAAHQWHAGSAYNWDKMIFPPGANNYTKTYVNAWINGNKARMDLMGTTAMTGILLGMTTVSTGFTLTVLGGLSEVEIKDTATGFDMSVIIVAANLGHQHAIGGCDIGC